MSEISTTEVAGLVTVVIPAYNAERWLPETLESLFAQVHRELEIIVVDDGSRDGTALMLQQYGERVTYVHQANSGGCSAPRNNGLRRARGEFVTFFDADDLMRPEKLAMQVEFLRQHPQIDTVLTDYRNFSAQGPAAQTHFQTCPRLTAQLAGAGESVLPAEEARSILIEENYNISNSPMFRTRALREIGGFDEALKASEDFDLLYRATSRGPIGVLARVGFDRRFHESNMSNRAAYIMGYKIVSREKALAGEKSARNQRALRRALARLHLDLANELASGDPRAALKSVRESWRYDPAAAFAQIRCAVKCAVRALTSRPAKA